MSNSFFSSSLDDQKQALAHASDASGRPMHLLEKDVWVVWALQSLFSAPFGGGLVFKGGTSLSKAYKAIRRFSEDVDLTYDIRALAPDLVKDGDAIPESRSQAKKWTEAIRHRLPHWLKTDVQGRLIEQLAQQNLRARVIVSADDKISIEYDAIATYGSYVKPRVLLEFGARSTGEPADAMAVACDAAEFIDGLTFPAATPRVMSAERTFWEKMTAMHVYCAQGRYRGGDRFARHWHDVMMLDEADIAKRALSDRELRVTVARHKMAFFAEKAADGQWVDYHKAVAGELCVIPGDQAFTALEKDYQKMVDEGLLLDDAISFASLIEKCAAIQEQANSTTGCTS